jgi:uncharacterized protein with GYD domain
MPIYITQGKYTSGAIKHMITMPEDRSKAVARLAEEAGGRLIDYYITSGENDFLVITEMPDMKTAISMLMAVGAGGAVSGLKTVEALPASEARSCFHTAGELAGVYKVPGSQ